MLIQKSNVPVSEEGNGERKEFIVTELVESWEVKQDHVNSKYCLVYEKVEWRKVSLLYSSNSVVESRNHTEECLKMLEFSSNTLTPKCIRTIFLDEDHVIEAVIQEIKDLY
ncbi:hypothetical protein ACJ2A9_07290 [Anaerobacillus sp. MEB173]|uniref:hypothetical protein n=1 Tax=Anaerobacillus sp. MEB173 TaxID=3383345 RepID=UPI003F91C752